MSDDNELKDYVGAFSHRIWKNNKAIELNERKIRWLREHVKALYERINILQLTIDQMSVISRN